MSTPWTYNPQPPRPAWGVHAETHKAPAMRRPIGIAPPPGRATLCLVQGAAGCAEPMVQAGECVATGQPVARHPGGTLVHAPITGVVESIGPQPVPGPVPLAAPCIVLRRTDPEHWHASCDPVAASLLTPGEIRARIARGGIVGLGGALFPTATKLAGHGPVRALIVNGAECEPWISCDEMLLRERAAMVVNGTRILMRALDTAHAVIAVEADMPEARIALDAALRADPVAGIGIAVVTAKYPAGGERQLIELVTGEQVPSGGLPRDIGYLCQNVGTAAAIGEWFDSGRPLVSRIVTVTGGAVADPGNFEVRIGTPINALIEFAGGYVDTPARLLMGGPMMGYALDDDTLPVIRATNCIVVARADEVAAPHPELPCIRCGACVDACPARLMPHELLQALRRGAAGLALGLGLRDCIECGCCDHVCPSYITLTARFASARQALVATPETPP